jgi:hypothetical protein
MQVSTGLRRQKWKLSPVLAWTRPEPACLPFPSLRITLAVAGVNLQIFGFSHFFANARFQFRRSFAGHVAAPTDRTTGEGTRAGPLLRANSPSPWPPSFGAAGMTAGLKLACSHTVPTSSEAALASNLFDVAAQPKYRETVIIDHLLACLSPVPLTFSLISPPFGPSTPNRQPGAG